MIEVIVVCLTAIICSIIIAGGINRAAFYYAAAMSDILKEVQEQNARLYRKVVDIKKK